MVEWFIEIVIRILLQYVSLPFFVFNLAIGFSIFFLYFYGTAHWKDLPLTKGVIYCLAIGFFSVAILTVAVSPIASLLVAFHAENLIAIMFYPLPIVFVLYLFHIRSRVNAPLYSEQSRDYFHDFLLMRRCYWPYLMIAASFTGFLLLGWNNPFLDIGNVLDWGHILFLGASNYMIIVSYILILWFAAQMSSFSRNNPIETFLLAIKHCLLSAFKEDICILRIIEEEKKQAPPQRKRKLPRIDYTNILQRVLVVILLATVVMASNMAFQTFSPSVQAATTQYPPTEINLFRFWNDSILYTVQIEKTYWINMPIILSNAFNLSIPNPSNFTTTERSELVWYSNQLNLDIDVDKTLSYSTTKSSDGRIEYLNIMPLNNSLQIQEVPTIKLAYADMLDLNLIYITEPDEKYLDNDSIAVSISLFINNTEPLRLTGFQFPLFQTNNYGNLTSFTWFENGIEKPSHYNDVRNDWLWSTIYIQPKTIMNITVTATFEEKQQ